MTNSGKTKRGASALLRWWPHRPGMQQAGGSPLHLFHHGRILVLSAMGLFVDGFDLFMMSAAMPLLIQSWQITTTTAAWIGAVSPIGAIIGAASCGYLVDRLGRKRMLVINFGLLAAFTLGCSAASSLGTLLLLRFGSGICIGADYPASAAYMAEMLPERLRGRFMLAGFGFISLGALSSAACAFMLVRLNPSAGTWHVMLISAGIFTLLIFLLRLTLRESHSWQQRRQSHKPSGIRHHYRELFASPYRRRLVLTITPWFLLSFCAYSITFHLPVILAHLYARSDAASLLDGCRKALESMAFTDLFKVVGFVLSYLIIDRLGRLHTQRIGFAGAMVAMGVLAIADSFPDSTTTLNILLGGFILYNIAANAGPFPTTYILAAELFPQALRGSAHGLATSISKLGASLGILLLPYLMQLIGKSTAMLGMMGMMAAALLVTMNAHHFVRGIGTRLPPRH